MKKKNIKDIVEWNLCIGCGACFYACDKDAVKLYNFESAGIKPIFKKNICSNCYKCMEFCPGNKIIIETENNGNGKYEKYIGQTLEVWEGYATKEKIRFKGASGGALSALALYCLEKENMDFVSHIGKDKDNPYFNKVTQSKNYFDILRNAGSRYAPSSPCQGLSSIEETKNKAVFIGKPCDVAAVTALRKTKGALDSKLGLVLSFFCAGTPHVIATKKLITKIGMDCNNIKDIRYRGNGWPGHFVVKNKNNQKEITYEESWGFINNFRPFRCHLCPDGLGEFSDITCGDAWHKYPDDKSSGRSLILVRTERGREVLEKAVASGYIFIEPSSPKQVVAAQKSLIRRRTELFGRLKAMKMILRPVPEYSGFYLRKIWLEKNLLSRIRIIVGTLRRLVKKGLWHKNYFLPEKR